MFSSKALEIRDPEIQQYIKDFRWNVDAVHFPTNFVKQHRQWLINNTFYIQGLDRFEYGYITAGCTDAFNEIRKPYYVLPDEYTYHRDAKQGIVRELNSIPPNSTLMTSYPFAATGNRHESWNEILHVCSTKNIKIFVDACLSGVSLGKLDLTPTCISHVAFSFSKAFGTGHKRTGVVYSNQSQSPAATTNKHLYINHMFADLHSKLMSEFSSDYIFKKYRSKQIDICEKHSLIQSDCVLFGLDNNMRKCVTRALETR